MADPVSLAITIGLNLASMALTASKTTEGPRLQDLTVSVANYGTPIPYLRGTKRIECPCFYAEPIKETRVHHKGKGGKYNEYKYFGTWASLVAGNEVAQIPRCWIDRHLARDTSGTASLASAITDKGGGSVTFYKGDEAQTADPRMMARIEADEGVGRCPAYRGTAYIMFVDIPLLAFGNRLPQVSAEGSTEVVGAGAGNYIHTDYFDSAYYPATDYYGPAYQSVDYVSPNEKYILGYQAYDKSYLFDNTTHTNVYLVDWRHFPFTVPAGDYYGFSPIAVDDNGRVWGQSSGYGEVFYIDKTAPLAPVYFDTWTDNGGAAAGLDTKFAVAYNLPNGDKYLLIRPKGGDTIGYPNELFYHAQTGEASLTKTSTAASGATFYASGTFQDDVGDIWLTGTPRAVDTGAGGDLSTIYLYRITNVTGASPYGSALKTITGLPVVTVGDGLANQAHPHGYFFGGKYVGSMNGDNPYGTAAGYVFSYDLTNGALITHPLAPGDLQWLSAGDTVARLPQLSPPPNTPRFYLYSFLSGDRRAMWEYDAATLTVAHTYNLDSWQATVAPEIDSDQAVVWLPQTDAFVASSTKFTDPPDNLTQQGDLRFYFIPFLSTGLTVGKICEIVALQAGMPPSEFNFLGLDQPVYGYSWSQGPANAIVSPLVDLHDSDIRPNGFIQEGIKRNQPLAGPALTADWFASRKGADGARGAAGQPLYKVSVLSESNLPKRVYCTFADPAGEQQANTAAAQRAGESVKTQREVSVDMTNLSIAANDIQPLVERWLRRYWIGSTLIEASLSPREIDLIPGHVRNLTFEDGTTIRARLTHLSLKPDRSMDTRWEQDGPVPVGASDWTLDTGAQQSLDIASTGTVQVGRPPAIVPSPVGSVGYFLDLPLLDDSDQRTAPFVYLAGSPTDPLGYWPGEGIYSSPTGDPNTFTAFDALGSNQASTYGTTATALSTSALPSVIDEGSRLTVNVTEGALTSITQTALESSSTINMALVGDEIIQFRNATLTGPGTYVLSGLVRGCRGTEAAMTSHSTTERFIMLVGSKLVLHTLGASDIGQTNYYKYQTVLLNPDSIAGSESHVFTANARRPFSPAQGALSRNATSGDWTGTFVRRTRIGGSAVNGQDVPLGETSEAYRIKILNGSTVVRTINVTTPAFTYTSAEQTADFGAAQTTLTVDIYQMAPDLSLEGHAARVTG